MAILGGASIFVQRSINGNLSLIALIDDRAVQSVWDGGLVLWGRLLDFELRFKSCNLDCGVFETSCQCLRLFGESSVLLL